jgi:mRNA-degrading endonuclease RelE of RelBE toxin-antitoxin system
MNVKKMAGTRNIYRVRVDDYRILIELEIHTLKVFSVVLRKKL